MARTKLTARRNADGKVGSASKKKSQKKEAKRKSTLASAGGIKKPHRFRPGTVAEREIRKYQGTRDTNDATKLFIPKAVFHRIFKEIAGDYKTDVRIKKSANDALQYATESLVQEIFEKTQQLTQKDKLVGINLDNFLIATEFKFPRYPVKHSGYIRPRRVGKEASSKPKKDTSFKKERKVKDKKIQTVKKAKKDASSDDEDSINTNDTQSVMPSTIEEGTESV